MSAESRIAIQGRVFFALIMREMTTRFGRSAGGYIWAVLEPASHIALLSLIFNQIARHPPLGDNFPFFFATGYMAFHFYADISGQVSASLAVNRPLLSFPRINLLDAVFARFTLQFITCCFVTVIILGGLYVAGEQKLSVDPAPIFVALGLASLLGLAIGALNCVLYNYSTIWERIFKIVNRPIFLVSGIFFTYESLPREIQDVIWWNPLIHITATMRSGFYPRYEPGWVSLPYVLILSLGVLMSGVLLLRVLRAQILEQ